MASETDAHLRKRQLLRSKSTLYEVKCARPRDGHTKVDCVQKGRAEFWSIKETSTSTNQCTYVAPPKTQEFSVMVKLMTTTTMKFIIIIIIIIIIYGSAKCEETTTVYWDQDATQSGINLLHYVVSHLKRWHPSRSPLREPQILYTVRAHYY